MRDLNISSFDYDNIESVKKIQSDFCSFTERNHSDKNDQYYQLPVITDGILESTLYFGIIKTNTSHYFPIFTILENSCNNIETTQKQKTDKCHFSDENTKIFSSC